MLLLFTIGWALSGIARRRELLRLRALSKQAQQQAGNSAASTCPGVTVVLPVKECRDHSQGNWRSQLAVQYGKQPLTRLPLDCQKKYKKEW